MKGSLDNKNQECWSKFRDFLPLLASSGLPLRTKGKLYFACLCNIMLYEIETWSVKEENVTKLKRNGARMVRWMCNFGCEDRIPINKLRTKLKLNNFTECLLGRRLPWFGLLERMEENTWFVNVQPSTLVVASPEDHLGKHWLRESEVIWKKGK